MGEVDAVVGIFLGAIVVLFGIAIIDLLPAAEGALSATYYNVQSDVSNILVLAAGGTVTLIAVIIARLRAI